MRQLGAATTQKLQSGTEHQMVAGLTGQRASWALWHRVQRKLRQQAGGGGAVPPCSLTKDPCGSSHNDHHLSQAHSQHGCCCV